MTDNQRSTDSAPLPAPVTGVARGGHGTGTALDDTQLYDVSDFTPVPPAAAAASSPAAARALPPQSAMASIPQVAVKPEPAALMPAEPSRVTPAPVASVPVVAAPVASAPVTLAGSRIDPSSRTTSRRRRVAAPVAGLAGFALAAGLAILVGAVLGGVPMPDGAAAGDATVAPTEAAPAPTKAPDPDSAGGGGNGDGGNGKGNGKKDDDNGNGNGRGNGND